MTVVIPTCDRPLLLRRAISSVLVQSHSNIEVLVIDDGVDCSGRDVCAGFDDRRLRWYRNTRTRGACGCRNVGLSLASGVYFAGLDDDDYFHRDRLSVLYSAYRGTYSFVSSNLTMVTRGGDVVRFRGSRLISMADILWGNCVGNQIFTETIKVRTVGGYNEQLESAQDFDLWIRLIERWGAGYRVGAALYYMDQDHGMPRISTSGAKIRGATQFYRVHREKFTLAQRSLYRLELRRLRYSGVPLKRKLYTLCHIGASLFFPSGWLYRWNVYRNVW